MQNRLERIATEGSDDDIGFILGILRRYHGEAATHNVVKEIIARLAEDDPRLSIVEICLQATGVVSGEFGFAEAYRRKKAEVAPWLDDARPQVRKFTERYLRHLDNSIALDHRRGEERRELRRRRFESDDPDG